MYEILFDKQTIEYLNRLELSIKKRIYNKIMHTSINPLRYFVRLTDRSDYKLRVGDYRIIADIDLKLKRIHITYIGHRKNVYNNI